MLMTCSQLVFVLFFSSGGRTWAVKADERD